MPISAPYISAKMAMIRLAPVNAALGLLPTLFENLTNSGNGDVIAVYKKSILNHITNTVQRATDESIVSALAGASESDEKNSLLTPVITTIPVNPAAPANAIEQAAMIAEGLTVADDLNNLLNNANTILK